MFRWANRHVDGFLVVFLPALLVLSGCATNYHHNSRHVPDWEAEDSGSMVTGANASPAAESPTNQQIIVASLPEPQAAPSLVASAPLPASAPSPTPKNVAPPPALPQPHGKPTVPNTAQLLHAWVRINSWCREHNLPAPRASLFGTQPTYSITTTSGVFSFHIGSTVASWQGVQLWLGFVPRLIDGQPVLHALDVQKNLLPLAEGRGLVSPGQHTIVIDPGHGGENGGTRGISGRGVEKDYTLDWARRLLPLLQANDWTVFLTRTNDTDLALSNRVAFAEQRHADLFVSLHFNSAAPDEAQFGLETYCLPPAGMPSGVTRGFRDEIGVTFPNNAFDAPNLELALRVHRVLLAVNGGHDRGVRRARFPGVLRNQHRPAILIEGGYLSNPGEAALIATAGHRQRLAEALALAIGPAETRVAQAQEPSGAATPAPPPLTARSVAAVIAPLVPQPAATPPPAAAVPNSKSALYDEP
jgi:N-acetylmuramoyl-L-alanine amidase